MIDDSIPAPPPLRPYQAEAAARVVDTLLAPDAAGTLLLMATGTGKTRVACEIMRRWLQMFPGVRLLFLAHRDELIQQVRNAILANLDIWADIEQAEARDGRETAILIGSAQTMCRPGRLTAHKPDEFSLVICDEVHHYSDSNSWSRGHEHFTGAKRLGLTATATRADGKKLGAEWDSVAYEYGLRQAIADGHLVPIRRKAIMVEGLCLDDVATRQGDLVPGQLEAKVLESESTVHAWAKGILEAGAGRKVLAFCPGVESSQRLAECLNRYAQDGKEIARHIDGETDRNERRLQIARFKRNEYRVLSNCGLFLEGFDEPSIDCIAMCRPTKSPTLYVQCLGRATRLFPPLKRDALVLDFTSNSQRHDIVTAIDILADDQPDDIRRDAERELDADPSQTVEQAIAKAQQRAEAKAKRGEEEAERRRTEGARAHVKARAQVLTFEIDRDPDAFLRVDRRVAGYKARRFGARPLSEKQLALVVKAGYQTDQSTEEGQALDRERFNAIIKRISSDLCSVKQAIVLQRAGIDPSRVAFQNARRAIDALAACRWHPPASERARIEAIARGAV